MFVWGFVQGLLWKEREDQGKDKMITIIFTECVEKLEKTVDGLLEDEWTDFEEKEKLEATIEKQAKELSETKDRLTLLEKKFDITASMLPWNIHEINSLKERC